MTLPVERSRTRKPVTWVTIIGVMMLPVVLAGILVAGLNKPTERLDNVRAAIVNSDDPVTIDGQLIPLGRQLTAGLVEGSDDLPSNVDWTISNADDAASGLKDGTYVAVVDIPKNFSAAATSTAPGKTPEKATIQVTTSPDARVVDDALTRQITQTAASVLGNTLSQTYLENVFIGFNTLGDNLQTAANGATSLADGLTALADGGTKLTDGANQATSGASQLASGAADLGTGLNTIASNMSTVAGGVTQLGTGLRQAADALQYSNDSQNLVAGAAGSAASAKDTADETAALAGTLGALAQECTDPTSDVCTKLVAAASAAVAAAKSAGKTSYVAGLVGDGVPTLITTTAGGMRQAADGADQLGSGAGQLAAGTAAAASGAAQLGTGATQLSAGVSQLASGAGQLTDGITQAQSGASSLGSGLQTAVNSLPRYSDSEAKSLATVVADPVEAQGGDTSLFGGSAVPLLAMLVLWFGGLGSFVVFQAVSTRALASRSSSAMLALRGLAPAAVLGAIQGVLVAGVVQIAASYDWGDWWAFAGLCMLAGVAFAAVNQALVALLGGMGRLVAAAVGAMAVAAGVVSTAPSLVVSIAGILPTSPAYTAMLGVLGGAGGVGAGAVGMLVWTLLALIATTVVVARRRKISAQEVLATSIA